MPSWDWDWTPGSQPKAPAFNAPPRQRWSVALTAALMLAVAATVAWFTSLHHPFINEDIPAIVDNTSIRSLWPITPALSPPDDTAISGLPVVNISFALDRAIWGTNPFGYRLTSLALHVGAAILLFAVVRRMLRLPTLMGRFGARASVAAGMAALLWMLHPLQTASVTSVVQRGEILAGLFSFAACYAFLGSLTSKHPRRWYWLAIAATLLGVGAGRVAAAVAPLILVADALFVAGTWGEVWRQRRWMHLGLFASWLLLGLLVVSTNTAAAEAGFNPPVPVWDYVVTQPGAVLHYLKQALWPAPLVFDYGNEVAHGFVAIAGPLAVLAVLAVASIWALQRRHPAGFAGLWFFVFLAPTSSLWPVPGDTIAEPRMYVPLAAVHVAFVLALRVFTPIRRLIVCCAVAVTSLAFTMVRNTDYRSELAIWEHNVAARPQNPRGYCKLGLVLLEAGRREEAIACFKKALAIAPDFPEVYSHLGSFEFYEGDVNQAIDHFRKLVKLRPQLPEGFNGLGRALVEVGKLDEAIKEHEIAVKLAPTWNEARVNLGQALLRDGRWLDAIRHYQISLKLDPNDPVTHYELGLALERAGRRLSAFDQYEAALRLDPGFDDARESCERLSRELALPRAPESR